MEKRIPFYENQIYHIFNCGNGNEPIFRCDQNYEYFLRKYMSAMDPWWETQAWSLLPDQFHFIVQIKNNRVGTLEHTNKVSRAFGDFCNGYVQAYNKHHHRRGSLLRRAFKRAMIYKAGPIRNLVCFMHNLPVSENIVVNPAAWEYSSYNKLLRTPDHQFASHPLLRVFESKDQFILDHKTQVGAGSIELGYIPAASGGAVNAGSENLNQPHKGLSPLRGNTNL